MTTIMNSDATFQLYNLNRCLKIFSKEPSKIKKILIAKKTIYQKYTNIDEVVSGLPEDIINFVVMLYL